MISRATIEKVEALDLDRVIGRYVSLKRHGGEDEGSCPFTQHKHAGGFKVNTRKGYYKCFKCGEGGRTSIQFVMRHKGLSFPEAVTEIARDHGITIEYDSPEKGYDAGTWAERLKEQEEIHTLLERAQAEFQARLALEEHKPARTWLDTRAWRTDAEHDSHKLWGIGYAGPHNYWAGHPDQYDEDLYLAAGLIAKHEDRLYDTFRNRITLPLLDDRGRIVGFAGRSMEAEPKAKWINSRNADDERNPKGLFRKGDFVFGLYQAKRAIKQAGGVVYLTEGYPNVIRAHEHGVENIVAASGTAFTPAQAALLKRYADIVIYLPDPDQAGMLAMWRHVPTLLSAGLDVRFCFPNQHAMCAKWPDADLDELGLALRKAQTVDEETGELTGVTLAHLLKLHVGWLEHRLATKTDDMTATIRQHEWVADCIAAMPTEIARDLAMESARKGGITKVRTMVKHRLKEKMAEVREKQEAEQTEAGIRIGEDGCWAFGKKDVFMLITPYQIKLRYQLPKRGQRNDSEWVIEAWTAERRVFIRVDNSSLSSAKSFTTVFRNQRIEMNIDDSQLNRLITFLMKDVKVAEKIDILGYHPEANMLFFSNMAFDLARKERLFPNELSIIDHPSRPQSYYLPYNDPRMAPDLYKSSFAFRDSSFQLEEFATLLQQLWGQGAVIVLSFTIGAMFADYLRKAANPMQPFFPLLYLKGIGGSGKSTLAKMMSFFYTKLPQTIDMGRPNTEPAMGKIMHAYRNVPIVCDDYGKKKAIIEDLSAFFNSVYGGVGYSKTSADDQEETITYDVNAVPIVTSNIDPVDETGALQQRFVYLNFDNNTRSTEAMDRFTRLTEYIGTQSLTPITVAIMAHRPLIEANFTKTYDDLVKGFKKGCKDYEIPDRVLKNYALALTPIQILLKYKRETGVSLGAGIDQVWIQKTAEMCIIRQHIALSGKSVLAVFWDLIQDSVDGGFLKADIHYKIMPSFTDRHAGRVFDEPVIALRWSSFYNSYVVAARKMGITPQPDQALRYELTRHSSWMGESSFAKSDRFKPTDEESKAGKSGVTSSLRLRYLPIREEFACNLTGTADNQFS